MVGPLAIVIIFITNARGLKPLIWTDEVCSPGHWRYNYVTFGSD